MERDCSKSVLAGRQLQRRKNRRRNLDQQPADDGIARGEAIDFASPEFA